MVVYVRDRYDRSVNLDYIRKYVHVYGYGDDVNKNLLFQVIAKLQILSDFLQP